VTMRMPTRLGNGEGRVSGEAIDTGTRLDPPGYGARHVGRVMRVIGGDPSRRGLAASPSHRRRAGRESERAIRPLRLGNAGGGKGPHFWCALDGAEDR
jgi:hypothetical protein